MSKKLKNILYFLQDTTIDEKRQEFRKNLIVLLRYYSQLNQGKTILVSTLKVEFNRDPWFLAGVLYQKEHEFIKESHLQI